MDWRKTFAIGIAAGLAGCQFQPAPPPPSLDQTWLFGVERVVNDPLILKPVTNRLLADLAAMPNVQVITLADPPNGFDFSAYPANKLRLYPALHAAGHCMEFTYTVYQQGQQLGTFGLVVPALAAGPELDEACTDRAATFLYQAIAGQGW